MSSVFYYLVIEDQPLRYTIHKLSKMSDCGLACSMTHCDGALSNCIERNYLFFHRWGESCSLPHLSIFDI